MDIGTIALRRLEIISKELRSKFPFVIGLKLSGSLAEGHYFYLQFGDEYISSDYDVVVLVNKYPSEREIEEIHHIISKPILGVPEEKLILRDLDIKILTTEYPYKGVGVKVASIYDSDINVQRHLVSGKIVFGKEVFEEVKPKSDWILRQLAHRITKRKRIIDSFIELGYLDRVATIYGIKEVSEKIKKTIRKFKNYHIMSDSDIEKLVLEVDNIKKSLCERIDYTIM